MLFRCGMRGSRTAAGQSTTRSMTSSMTSSRMMSSTEKAGHEPQQQEAYSRALATLDSYEAKGIILGLDRVRRLLAMLGSPQDRLRIIHVAGTNGKGSVCAMLHQIFSEAGCRTGMYTSPHLFDVRERIVISNEQISKHAFSQLISEAEPLAKEAKATYFELLTVLALLHFSRQRCGIVILETGLGGRLDATNVGEALLSIITSVSREHTDYLGKSIREIAAEKAGIIREHGAVVSGASGEAQEVIRRIAIERKAELFELSDHDIRKAAGYRHYLSLKGGFQLKNLALVLKAVSVLKERQSCTNALPDAAKNVSPDSIRKALASVRLPARFEWLADNIIFDGAHNIEGMQSLAREIENLRKRWKHVIVMLAIMKDKPIRDMLRPIVAVADTIIVTRAPTKRSADPKAIAAEIEKLRGTAAARGRASATGTAAAIEAPSEALACAKKLLAVSAESQHSLLVIAGSLYLYSSIINALPSRQ